MELVVKRGAKRNEFYDSYTIYRTRPIEISKEDRLRIGRDGEERIRLNLPFSTVRGIGGVAEVTIYDDGLLEIEVWIEEWRLYSDFRMYRDGTVETYGVPIPASKKRFMKEHRKEIMAEVEEATGLYELLVEKT